MARIQYVEGDIFDSKAQVIVNTVNCQGIMGKGLALAFKQRYPEMFTAYQEDCKVGRLRIGRPKLYQASNPWILNFPTKDSWRGNAKIEYLEKGLEYFVANYKKAGVTSIAFPKLGTQNGKLSWDEVGPLMASYLEELDINVYVYIAENDREYHKEAALEHAKLVEAAWKKFNSLACSIDDLRQKVQLNQRDAKRISNKRQSMEFASQQDIDSMTELANTFLILRGNSLKSIF